MSETDWESLLNDKQYEAVTTTEGPVLILAGAGSGKTRALTYRVAYLIEEEHVAPWNICAITFTNKAAGEMRDRINALVEADADDIWVATFHSSCVRILRRYADKAGYDRSFSIYDADDQKTVMKALIKKHNLDPKKFRERSFLNVISHAKDELIDAEAYSRDAGADPVSQLNAEMYREYEERLRENNAMDFDDLIINTVKLLKEDAEVREYYQRKFRYVMVDEYQDTNTAQFELVRLLSGGEKNLCVVGDDDQSIYKFRGANIRNILNFEHYFPDATVIRLEQNYRSTKTILAAANDVIKNNAGRKEKTLWTENEDGAKITFRMFDSSYEEAEYIADDVARKARKGEYRFSQDAVLYRTNAQSRTLEEKFLQENIPYKIVGGVNFYSRKEIKDVLAYMKVIDNGADDLSVERIINVPKRGIGAASVAKAAAFAEANGQSLYEGLLAAGINPAMRSAAGKIRTFTDLIENLKKEASSIPVPLLIEKILETTGYSEALKAEGTDEAQTRIENLDELYNKAVTYQNEAEEPTLSGFLEEVALIADIDNLPQGDEYVLLMTLHGAKGLEFPNVYMAGMEDGLFPSFMSITADDSDEEIEEERRLCYVGITRAKEHLTMTAARKRMVRGEIQYAKISRFVKEIDESRIDGDLRDGRTDDEAESVFGGGFGSFGTKAGFSRTDYGSSAPGRKAAGPAMGTNPYTKPVAPKNFGTKIEKAPLDYGVGDRVRHRKFGEGTVTAITDGGRDYEVTVDFDGGETKKMFASFAKLEKV